MFVDINARNNWCSCLQNAIAEAAKRAGAMFVEALPEKFETRVGQGGEKLSGGQVCWDN
jgi:ABC-type multidrug transport system fused ATPase/permease subunit